MHRSHNPSSVRRPGSPRGVRGRLLAGLLLAVSCVGQTANEPFASSRAVRAALILQLINFVEWPEGPKDEIQVCVLGDEPLAAALRSALTGGQERPKSGGTVAAAAPRPVVVSLSRLKSEQDSRTCHVVAVGDYDERQVRAYLAGLQARPVVTVGSSEDFLRQGGMVRFRLTDGRIAIEVSQGPLERSRLRFSSKLLRLARMVNLEKEGNQP